MYGAWDSQTGHNAALHKGEGFENVHRDDVLTVDVAVEYWLSQGKALYRFYLHCSYKSRSLSTSGFLRLAVILTVPQESKITIWAY